MTYNDEHLFRIFELKVFKKVVKLYGQLRNVVVTWSIRINHEFVQIIEGDGVVRYIESCTGRSDGNLSIKLKRNSQWKGIMEEDCWESKNLQEVLTANWRRRIFLPQIFLLITFIFISSSLLWSLPLLYVLLLTSETANDIIMTLF